MGRHIEFAVEGIVTGVSGQLHVIGRNCEDLVRLGDVFESSYEELRDSSANGAVPRCKANVTEVQLRVVGISAYEKPLSELHPGMTGRLSLEGRGAEMVKTSTLLGSTIESAAAESQAPQHVSGPVTLR
jgi:hypothetical protein